MSSRRDVGQEADDSQMTPYDEKHAPFYDTVETLPLDTSETVRFLKGLAGDGAALELGIGTGRVAIPLAETGIRVVGLDNAPAMLAQLQQKDPAGLVTPVLGDFRDFELNEQFRVIYVVFNALYLLPTQRDQVRCFTQAGKHLEDDGVFVVEAYVPEPKLFDRGQRVHVKELGSEQVVVDLLKNDPVAQRTVAQRLVVTEAGIRLFPVSARYAWPSEMDLMGELAGFTSVERYGGWQAEPFTSLSFRHVSLYRRNQGEA